MRSLPLRCELGLTENLLLPGATALSPRGIRSLLLVAGALLLATGLALPPAALVRVLDTAAEGQRWRELWSGAWILKTLLSVHGAWLLAATVRPWRRRELAAGRGDRLAPLWEPVAAPGATGDHRAGVFLVCLLIVAAVLRWFGLGFDLWYDEVFTLLDFARPPFAKIISDYSSDNQHLLYSLAAHASMSVFGESAVTLRLPALVLGLASLWATLRLSRLTTSEVEGLFVVALLAFSYHHIWFSQNARGYSGLLLTTVLATELFLRGLWKDEWSAWLLYAAVGAAGMGFHPTMIFVVAAHGLVFVWLAVRNGGPASRYQRGVTAFVLTGTLTAQLYALVLPQVIEFYLQPSAGAMTADVEWKNPLWFVNETIHGLGVGLAFGWLGLIGAALLFAVGFLGLFTRNPLPTVCFVLPALFGGATLLLLDRNLWPRFFFNLLAFAALFAIRGAFGIAAMAPRRLRWADLGPAFASLLVVASAAMVPRIYRHPKQDFSGARDFVYESLEEGDRVVALDLAGQVYAAYYAPEMATAFTLEELLERQAQGARTWILYTLPEHMEATQPALWRHLSTHFEVVREFPGTLSGGAVVVLRRDEAVGARNSRSGG